MVSDDGQDPESRPGYRIQARSGPRALPAGCIRYQGIGGLMPGCIRCPASGEAGGPGPVGAGGF